MAMHRHSDIIRISLIKISLPPDVILCPENRELNIFLNEYNGGITRTIFFNLLLPKE